MRFSRKNKSNAPATDEKSAPAVAEEAQPEGGTPQAAAAAGARPGPRDVAEVDLEGDGVQRVDLSSLLVAPAEGLELRMQVNEGDGQVQSVLLTGSEGAVEIRAFAASRNGSMWDDVRRQIAAETARQGGTATEREGAHGTELYCEMTVKIADGRTGRQPTRVVGFDGPRWFLRATYLGKAAVDPGFAAPWEDAVNNLVVRRGDAPMAPGDPLPITLPPQARRMAPPAG